MSEVTVNRAEASDVAAAVPVMRIEQVLEGQSPALALLNVVRAITAALDRVYAAMGYICGALLLLLGLFITYQVIARKLGIIMAPGTDQMSGYTLVLAATWAFSYGLRTGSHVRIDVLLPFMPPKLRAFADWVALGSIAFFAIITAWKTWTMVMGSYEIEAFSLTYPRTPLWIPQTVLAIGFSMLAFTCLHMMINMPAEAILTRLHKLMGGTVNTREVTVTTSPLESGPPAAV